MAKRTKTVKTPLIKAIEDLTGEPNKVWGEGTPWRTKSEFYVWLRGLLRRGWTKHPLKIQKIVENRFKVDKKFKNGKVTQVWNCSCEICGVKGPQKDFQVDHIIPAGSLTCYDDVLGFLTRLLYVKPEDLRILCKQCNSTLAYADKQGVSFEEAAINKEAIRIMAQKKDKEWLTSKGRTPASNAKSRREQIIEVLKQEDYGKVVF